MYQTCTVVFVQRPFGSRKAKGYSFRTEKGAPSKELFLSAPAAPALQCSAIGDSSMYQISPVAFGRLARRPKMMLHIRSLIESLLGALQGAQSHW